MHNRKLPHEEERPCFICGTPTKALRMGKIENTPRCSGCRERLAEEHTKALYQQRKQDQATRNPRKEA